MDNSWNFFQETGDIEAYLLYVEYKKLFNGEYSQEFMEMEQVMENEREDEGAYSSGDEYRGSGQDADSSYREER